MYFTNILYFYKKKLNEIFEIRVMKIAQLNQAKIPIVKFDKKLERFRGKVMFPEKLAKANEILSRVSLPKLAVK